MFMGVRRGQWTSFTLVLFLFVGFRLSLLAFWPADQLARWSDYDYYYEIARWVDQGRLPYIHYWVEYPPLFPYLSVLLYLLAPRYITFATVLALVQLAFEIGSLVLLYRLARRVLGEAQADRVAWVYALLFAPVATWWLSFDSLVTFFLLWTVERWLAGRRGQSALVAGVGGLAKWFPLLFLPVAVRFRRDWREALRYVAATMAVVVVVVGLLAALSPMYTLASLRSLASRASWQTVWALVDGNLGTGAYGANRLDPAVAILPQGNPARVPSWLAVPLFGMLYLWLWHRVASTSTPAPPGAGPSLDLRLVRFFTVTVLLFFLWSRGWSPQWLGMVAPLVLLCLPLERSVLYLSVLTFINIAEWPVLLSRGMNQWLYLTVPLRTALLVLLTVELWRKLRK
jgi:hypothetical protein